jgi:hypothetical protein
MLNLVSYDEEARRFGNYLRGEFSNFHKPIVLKAWQNRHETGRWLEKVKSLVDDLEFQTRSYLESEVGSQGVVGSFLGSNKALINAVTQEAKCWAKNDLINWANGIDVRLAGFIKDEFARKRTALIDSEVDRGLAIASKVTGITFKDRSRPAHQSAHEDIFEKYRQKNDRSWTQVVANGTVEVRDPSGRVLTSREIEGTVEGRRF